MSPKCESTARARSAEQPGEALPHCVILRPERGAAAQREALPQCFVLRPPLKLMGFLSMTSCTGSTESSIESDKH